MPQPYYDQGDTYWCSFHMTDIEPDDPTCEERNDIDKTCMSCPYCTKQSYKIVIQNPNQRHLISPEMSKMFNKTGSND